MPSTPISGVESFREFEQKLAEIEKAFNEKCSEIAKWMYEEYQKGEILVQSHAAEQITKRFGKEFVYRNRNYNWAIRKPILEEFRKLTGNRVVWSRGGQFWRKRVPRDPPGRRMVA